MRGIVFTLKAPQASFGDDRAANENRTTRMYPTKSAIIGMLGASIGDDKYSPDKIVFDGLRFAYGTINVGDIACDFQNWCAPAALAKRNPKRNDRFVNKLTNRFYLENHHSIIYVELTSDIEKQLVEKYDCSDPLEYLCKSLCEPQFPLFAGRKKFAIEKTKPIVVGGDTLKEVFAKYMNNIIGFQRVGWDTSIISGYDESGFEYVRDNKVKSELRKSFFNKGRDYYYSDFWLFEPRKELYYELD